MLTDFTEKKKAFFTLKTEFFPSPKKRVFPKGLTYDLVKKCQFFLSLDLVKIRLEIMLNDFAEKKETFFGYKKQNFSKSKKSAFPMGLAPLKKCDFLDFQKFCFLRPKKVFFFLCKVRKYYV